MKIADVLKRDAVITDLKKTDKIGVIRELIAPCAGIAGSDPEALLGVLMERERLGSTGIGGGAAIPHGRYESLDKVILGFGISKGGVDFDAVDGEPAYIFFLLLAPENATGLPLRILARLSRMLKNNEFKEKLQNAEDADTVFSIIEPEDREL